MELCAGRRRRPPRARADNMRHRSTSEQLRMLSGGLTARMTVSGLPVSPRGPSLGFAAATPIAPADASAVSTATFIQSPTALGDASLP